MTSTSIIPKIFWGFSNYTKKWNLNKIKMWRLTEKHYFILYVALNLCPKEIHMVLNRDTSSAALLEWKSAISLRGS